jgi:pyrophosphatase PpaX
MGILMKKIIIFDYNGVLVNDLDLHLEAFLELARRHNSNITREQMLEDFHITSREKSKKAIGSNDEKEIDAAQLEKEDIYIEMANKRGVLFPDTKETLEALSTNHELAIVSNSTQKQMRQVFPKDLLDKFKIVMTYEDIKKPKPDPSSINKVMEELGFEPEDTVFVGDSPNDMKTAQNAGVKAIGIDTGNDSEKELKDGGADVVIHSLKELLTKQEI